MMIRASTTPARPLLLLLFTVAACGHGGGGNGGGNNGPPPPLQTSRQFRAIAGISMGAYGAMNLGTKHADVFGVIGSLGGPVDMQQLLSDGVHDGLEVKPQTDIPRNVGDDFTFDHLPPYPDRDSRLSLFQDLVIAFGNPYLHNPDPARQYLASDSEPARIGRDDQFGAFTPPTNPRGFLDGGDKDKDGLRQTSEPPTMPVDVLLLAGGTVQTIAPGATGIDVGNRQLADLNGDGVYDVGDGIVVNYSEPFNDLNGNLIFEPELGETFSDVGLDGVPGTGDFGEGNGVFDYDPDRAHYLAEDPLTRVAGGTPADLTTQRIYMDVGTRDEFGFARHYTNFVATLRARGVTVTEDQGFSGNCVTIPKLTDQFLLVRYDGGHVGISTVDADTLFSADVCGATIIWQRLRQVIGYMNSSFPNGVFGVGDIDVSIDIGNGDVSVNIPDTDPRGDLVHAKIDSPALAVSGTAPTEEALVYRPPAFFHGNDSFPVVYFLGGYGQHPDDYARIRDLLDLLILTKEIQNMYFVFLPGSGGRVGSFYVNHVVPESQVPDVPLVTSGRYEDSIMSDLIPAIENHVLDGRVRH